MKSTKKFLSIVLAILMVISIIPITSSAATKSGTCGENVKWTYDDTTYTLTISGTGPMEKNGYGLLFAALTPKVQKVIICDGVTSICKAAFQQCLYLADVSIPNTVTVIDNHAFYNCPELTNITLPNSVTSIGNYAFGICDGFTSIALPDSVTTIGNYAFSGCNNLTSITIPDSVTSIGEGAFARCVRLADVKIPDGITTINEETFDNCTRLLSITIPKSVTTIKAYAFRECHLLMNVYYLGTKEEWEAISIEQSNTTNKYLLNTTIYYYTHNYRSEVTAPTCTEQGYTTYTCECGDTYVSDYVDALGHTEKIIPAVAPTCTETGLTEGLKCSVCGETLTEQKELPANGHTPATAVEENYVAPTCTENGSKDAVVYCSVCNEEIIRETVVIEEAGHSYTTVVTAPACAEQGYTTYTCECGDTYIDDYKDALGHTDNDGDGYCDNCELQLCDHICHKEGITGIIWRIINVFNMLFGLNKTCDCGVEHY